MKTNTTLSAGLAGILCFNLLLPCLSAWAGDLTVNNLTVVSSPTGVLPTIGVRYVIVEQNAADTDQDRGTKLLAAYAKAKQMSPAPSANNRITVLIPPGNYDLGAGGITLDTEYIDLIGLVPVQMTKHISGIVSADSDTLWERTVAVSPCPCGLVLTGSGHGVIVQTADHVRIANMILLSTGVGGVGAGHNFCYCGTDPAAYWPNSDLPDVVVEHVSFQSAGGGSAGSAWSMGINIVYSGVYRDCVAGDASFGFNSTASGTFEDCVGGNMSFGGNATASGTFIFCSAGGSSFGPDAPGIFRDCVGGIFCFGTWGNCSGTFEKCYGEYMSFGGSGTLSGHLSHCACSEAGFGFTGTISANAVLEYCAGGFQSFGCSANISSGATFDRCVGGAISFGGNGMFSPPVPLPPGVVLLHCKSGGGSFGTFYRDSNDFNSSDGFYAPQGDLSMGTFTQ